MEYHAYLFLLCNNQQENENDINLCWTVLPTYRGRIYVYSGVGGIYELLNYYLNQRWLIAHWKFQWNLNKNTTMSRQKTIWKCHLHNLRPYCITWIFQSNVSRDLFRFLRPFWMASSSDRNVIRIILAFETCQKISYFAVITVHGAGLA